MSEKEKIKILVPVDFSDHTENTLPMARYLAKVFGGEIHLLHVLEAPTGPMKMFSTFDEVEARKKALKMLDEIIEKYGSEVEYRKMIKVGKPYRKILEAAREINANAIVVGTHGAHGMKELMTGTNTYRVIRTAPCPVFSLRKLPVEGTFEKILLPLDLSKETGEKLKLGIEFAKKFDAELVLLSVLESNDEESRARLKKRMNMAMNHVRKHNVKAEATTLVSKGNIADLVVEYAREIGANLICIMTQQELDFKETFLGSNASHVVNHSDIPVVSIRPEREYREVHFSGSHFG